MADTMRGQPVGSMTHMHFSADTDTPDTTPEVSPPNPGVYRGRDLAWLDFNERVLAQSEDESLPLFDRLRFLGICESNLDEFFMKRIALLRRRIDLGLEKATHDGLSVRQQLAETRSQVKGLLARQTALWEQQLRPSLVSEGLRITAIEDLPPRYQARVDEWFHRHVFPILTPLAVDPGHPFPFISNLSRNFGLLLADPEEPQPRFARVKIPDAIPSWVRVPVHGPVGPIQGSTPCRIIRVADIVRRNLESIFPGLRILEVLEFRVTRGVGLEDDDDDVQDLAEWVRASLRHRRFAEAVRLEVAADSSTELTQLLLEELDLEPESLYVRGTPLSWIGLKDFAAADRPDLTAKKWQPIVPVRLADQDEPIFRAIRSGDILVNHPYDSFHASVERFIAEAADDPSVVAIKQCLYRTEPDSPFIHSLLRAAEAGKQVTCLVELRARFDEDRNLQLTRTLERHGVHVAYGVVGLKTHAKCSLVIRQEGGGYRAYAHVGTGNYHSVTANLYSDCGLLTCNEEITEDVIQVFNFLTGRSRHRDYKKLLVAPVTMRDGFVERINREIEHAKAGQPSRMVAKMNQLEDPMMMQAIVNASQAGVQCDLLVRGFCCLKAGVPGVTDNVRIISVIGEFLEHARIFYFADGQEDPMQGEWFIGSADWMNRNLSQRVEVAVPIEDLAARKRLCRILDVQIRDRHDAWVMNHDGGWDLREVDADAADGSPERLGTFATLRRDAMRAALDAMQDSKARSSVLRQLSERPSEPAPPVGLGGVERMAGMALLEGPWRTASEIGRRLHISPSLTAATGSKLAKNGFISIRKLGRHTVWSVTPLLSDALGGPLSLLRPDDWEVDWLSRRIARALRIEGWRMISKGATALVLAAESPEGERHGWCIKSDRRGAAQMLHEAMTDELSMIHAVGIDADVVKVLRQARRSMLPSERSRLKVLTLGTVLQRTSIEGDPNE